MKSKLFSGIKQFWQLIIYNRHFLSQTAHFVVSFPPCRNNSEKISPDFLESGKSRCTFASSIRQNKFWETQTDN